MEDIYDSVALEDHLLPEPVETFLLVALCWCLVAWLLRLCYMANHLFELQSAIQTQRLSSHDSVPLHAQVAHADPQTRTRFLSFLRTRTPATPTAAVPCYSVPLSLNGATLHVAVGELHRLEINLSLSCSATMQLFWGVTPEAPPRIVDLAARPRRVGADASSSSRANSALSRGAARWLAGASSEADAAQVHPQREPPVGAGGRGATVAAAAPRGRNSPASDVLAAGVATVTGARQHASSTLDGAVGWGDAGSLADEGGGASGGAPPRRSTGGYLRELGGCFASARCGGTSSNVVVRQLNGVQRGVADGPADAISISAGIEMRSGDEMRANASSRGATHGMTGAAEGGPSHVLPAECFQMASPPRRVGAGAQLREAFYASEMPSDLGLARLPLLLVLSNFQQPRSTASPTRREPKLAAASAASNALLPAAAAETTTSLLPAALADAPEHPVDCCMVHLTFSFGAAAAAPPSPAIAAAASPGSEEAGAAMEAGTAVVTPDAPPDALPDATSDALPDAPSDAASDAPLDTPLPPLPQAQAQAQAQAQVQAQAHPLSPDPDVPAAGGEPGTFSVAATLGKALARTPNAVLQLHDIFGLEDWGNAPECVACLTEPKDTILLPCRHLCVCHHCFDHLTLDKCPVCRAPFQSYLRFNVDDVEVVDDDTACDTP